MSNYSISSIELLARENPTKTGAELIAMQDEQKRLVTLAEEADLQEELAFIAEVNNAGSKYYRGRFGLNQYYYYRIFNARINDDEVIVDFEKIVAFDNTIGGTNLSIERSSDNFVMWSVYYTDQLEEVTADDWKKVNDYLSGVISLFW